jgi:CheY-like chemotaxis protein
MGAADALLRKAKVMPPATIAIIEDDPDTLALVHDLATQAGYQTVRCTRGAEAYPLIRATQPDLVILDLWLESQEAGGMVLGMLELDPVTQAIPVIVCSAHRPLLEQRAPYLQAKGHAVLAKPFTPEQLLVTILQALGHGAVREVDAG